MNDIPFSNLNITIVGLGLIGGSFAKSIKSNLNIKNLWAIDIGKDMLYKAKNSGVIDDGFIEPIFPLNNSDIVIMCTYPNVTMNFIKDNMIYFKKNAIITDSTGIKNKIINEINKVKRHDVDFIGGHPMAGKESVGYDFSDECIFQDAKFIITPQEINLSENILLLKRLFTRIGFKKVVEITPEIHDEIIAFTSQLPHIIACCLMNNIKLESGLDYIARSFKDVTRVANINCDLWSELIYDNKDNILIEIDQFTKDLKNIYDIIKKEDKENLISIFNKSSYRRKEMNDEDN